MDSRTFSQQVMFFSGLIQSYMQLIYSQNVYRPSRTQVKLYNKRKLETEVSSHIQKMFRKVDIFIYNCSRYDVIISLELIYLRQYTSAVLQEYKVNFYSFCDKNKTNKTKKQNKNPSKKKDKKKTTKKTPHQTTHTHKRQHESCREVGQVKTYPFSVFFSFTRYKFANLCA